MSRVRSSAEPMAAAALVALLGIATIAALGGVATSTTVLALAAGALGAVALTALVAADWLDGLVLAILALPLPAIYSNDSVRIAAVAPVTALIVFAWLLRSPGRRLGETRFPIRTGVALLVTFVLATAFATSPATSLRELVNILVLAAFVVLLTERLLAEPRRIDHVVWLVTAVTGVTGALAVLETLGIIPGAFPRTGTSFNRAALGFGQPNGLGLFLAVAIPLVLHACRTTTGFGRAAAIAALVAALFGLIGTFSRGGWLALLGASLVLTFAGAGRTAVRVWLFAAVFAVITDIATGGVLRDTVTRTIGDWVIEQRLALQLAGVLMFIDHPVLGVGPGGFAVNLDRYGAQIPQLSDYLPTPHNAYVQMAAETGVIGLLAFICFLAAGLFVAIRAARNAQPDVRGLRLSLLWSYATMCAAGLVVWPFAHGTGQAVLVVAAATFAVPREAP